MGLGVQVHVIIEQWKLVGSQLSTMLYSGLRGRRLYVVGINVDLLILHVQLEMDHKCTGRR
jgi:hypothetical protein